MSCCNSFSNLFCSLLQKPRKAENFLKFQNLKFPLPNCEGPFLNMPDN